MPLCVGVDCGGLEKTIQTGVQADALLSTITASLFPEMKPNVSLISQSKRLQRHVEWAAEKEAERKRSRN